MADVVNRAELAAHFERIETVIDHTEQLVERVETLLGHVVALGVRLEAVDRLHGHHLAEIVDALHCPPEAGGGKAAAVVEAVGRTETLLKDVLDALRSSDRNPGNQLAEPVGPVVDPAPAPPAPSPVTPPPAVAPPAEGPVCAAPVG